jgi:glycosyltransferase involved in cell wall biosynthesis
MSKQNLAKDIRLSIVVPTLNEAGNIVQLVQRIDRTLTKRGVVYEIVMIDDHSSDDTAIIAKRLARRYPLSFYTKQFAPGKAQSLLEGFSQAQYDTLAMIDADLQYPPEALPDMLAKLEQGSDVVIANRLDQQISWQRQVVSRAFRVVFGRWLHGLDVDIQSGMKLFRSEILCHIYLNPSPWTFDLEFLLAARRTGYSMSSVDITFSTRNAGQTKVDLLKTTWEIGWSSIKLKFGGRFEPRLLELFSDPGLPVMGWKGGEVTKKKINQQDLREHQSDDNPQ